MATSVLITGGAGFVGSAIVDAVRQQHPDWKVTSLDIKSPSYPKEGVCYEIGDITEPVNLELVIDTVQPTAIIHAAGLVPELADRYKRQARKHVFQVNVHGTQNVIAAAKNAGAKALVWTGSFTAVTDNMSFDYPNVDESWPTSSHSLIYGESKACRFYHQEERIPLTSCRQLLKP